MGEYGCATLFPSSFSQGDHRAEPPQVAKNMPLFPFPSKEKESRVRSSSQPHMWREEPMLWDERHFIVGMISRFLHPLDGTSVCSRCQNLKSMSLFLLARFISEWPSGLFSHGKVRVARFLLSLLLHPQYYYTIQVTSSSIPSTWSA